MVKAKVCEKYKAKTKADPRKLAGKSIPGSVGKKLAAVLSSSCCCECGEVIGEDTKALQCERCTVETWKCATCLGLSDELYDELTASSKNGLHWFCTKCEELVLDNVSPAGEKIADTLGKLSDKTQGIEQRLIENFDPIELQLVERINAVEQLLERKTESDTTQWQLVESRLKKLEERPAVIEEAQERIEFKVDQLKRNMDEPMVQVVQGAMEGVLQQDKEEEMEIERRIKNVIVHGVPESQVDSSDQRVEEDLAVLAAMFQEVGTEEVQVESVVRLGKRNTDSAHPRPMKVVLNAVDGKVKLLRNAKNLRSKQDGGWSKIFIHQDLTPRQREARKPLVAELKQRKANGENDLIIYNGKVIKRRGQPPTETN